MATLWETTHICGHTTYETELTSARPPLIRGERTSSEICKFCKDDIRLARLMSSLDGKSSRSGNETPGASSESPSSRSEGFKREDTRTKKLSTLVVRPGTSKVRTSKACK
jgi:hypothetical protein